MEKHKNSKKEFSFIRKTVWTVTFWEKEDDFEC